LAAVTRRPGVVLGVGLSLCGFLTIGIPRLYYEVDFGDQSLILRSVRFMEENLHRPMSTDLVVSIPEGHRIYDEASLRLLERLESYFADESSTGSVWSFLDFLEEAYRVDSGQEAPSFEALVAAAPRTMTLVAGQERVASYWSETLVDDSNGEGRFRDRARVSVNRSWLTDRELNAYLARLRRFVGRVNQEVGGTGYRVDLEGGAVLANEASTRIRDTQWRGFGSAFVVVTGTLVLLLRGNRSLFGWGVAVNLMPVLGLLGLMGWVGIGIDPANAMVAAILISIAVDGTIHIALRYQLERAAGRSVQEALAVSLPIVGEAVVISSLCLSLGFSVLMFSRWGGLVAFGLLASLGVAIALLADLLILPAALIQRERRAAGSAE
jgi:hypothetical protein